MGDSKTITVSTEFGEVLVHKMPLSDYAELLRALEKLPKKIGEIFNDKKIDFNKIDTSEVLALLPGMIADSWNDLIALIAVSTDKDVEFLNKIDGPDAIDVVVAIVELNDFPRIIASIKKLAALRTKIIPATPEPQK